MRRVLHIFLCLALPCLWAATSSFSQDIFEREKGLFETADINASATVGTLNKLTIMSAESLSGSIIITTAPGKAITIAYTKSAKTGSRSQAIDYIDLITVSLDKQGEFTRLEMRAPNPAPWDENSEAGMVTAHITVPPKCVLEINAPRFSVDAAGPLAGCTITSSLEKIVLKKIDGLVDVTTANQPVDLEDASGDISVVTTNAPISATNITSRKAAAKFRNDGGGIALENVVGPVNIRGDYGRIDIRRFQPNGGSSVIRGTGAPVSLQIDSMTDGQLVINNSDEDIDLTVPETISAFFSLSVDPDGTIEAHGMPFKTDLVQPSRLNIRTGEGDVNIRGSVSGKGSIFVRGTKGD